MKFQFKRVFLVGVMTAGTANAADIVATQFKAIETDLARSELQLDAPYSMRFGLNFAEGHRYLMHPSTQNVESSSSIRREFNFSLMLPASIEAGVSLYDNQEGSSANVPHKSQKLSGAVYARYHLIQNEGLRSSITLQYEPGTSNRNSFHASSQDKIGLVAAVDGTPIDYLQVGAYLGMTKRQDERFRFSRINDEVLYGLRVSTGPENVKVFADMQIRSMPWKTLDKGDTMQTGRHYEIGLQGSYRDIHLQVSKYVPTTERYVGVPERGFKISLNYVLGKSNRPNKMQDLEKTESPETLEKIEQSLEKDTVAPPPKSIDSFDELNSDNKEEGLGAIPIVDQDLPAGSDDINRNPSALEAPGKDEFEKLDATKAAESQQPETATEKAEREYRDQIARDEANTKTKEAQAKSDEKLEQERLTQELLDDEKKIRESAADIEKELNQYTLPGPDETNWDGLGNR